MRTPWPRRAAVLLLVLTGVLAPTVAWAVTAATVNRAVAVGTVSWGAAPSLHGSPAVRAALTVHLDQDRFIDVTNVGTATLGPRFTVTIPMTATSGASAELDYCDVGWNTTSDTCVNGSGVAGTVTVVAVSGSTYVFSLPTSFPPGYALVLRVHPAVPDTTGTQTTTMDFRVSNNSSPTTVNS